MKIFIRSQLKQALAYAENGGQALAMAKRLGTGIIFDENFDRLVFTCRRYGMWRGLTVHRCGKPGQCVFLNKAQFFDMLEECNSPEFTFEYQDRTPKAPMRGLPNLASV